MRAIAWLLLLSLSGWGTWQLVTGISQWPSWRKSTQANWDQAYTAYNVFWLDPQQALTFDIPANGEQIRLMFTATQGQGQTSQQNAAHKHRQYEVQYRILDQRQQVLKRASRRFSLDQELTNAMPGQLLQRFFDRPGGIRAHTTKDFFIDNSKQHPIRRIELRLSPGEQQRVAVRMSVLERRKDSDLPIIWQRMHRKKRAKLLAENIYPPLLVAEQQRRTALKYNWLPLGPEGTNGEDYASATLFINNTPAPLTVGQGPQIIAHMLAGQGKVFSFVNGPDVAAVTLTCQPLDGTAPGPLELLLQPVEALQNTRRLSYTAQQSSQGVPLRPDGALTQITSEKLCAVQLVNHRGNNILLDSQGQRAYLVDAKQSLNYALALDGEALQPLKIDLRGLATTHRATAPAQVFWRILARDGALLLSGRLTLNPAKDSHERLSQTHNDPSERLLKKTSHYILAPVLGSQLQISSTGPQALINVFTRPLALPYRQTFTALTPPKHWFSLLPSAYNELKAQRNSRVIYRQQRPLAVKPKQSSRAAQWRSITSQDQGATFSLLSRDERGQFQPLTQQHQSIAFSDGGRKTLTPSLIYIRKDATKASKIRLTIDQRTFDYWLTATTGKLTLPSLSAGVHQLAIAAPGQTQWFINKRKTDTEGDSARVRQVYPVNKQLTFTLNKTDPHEWVSFHYYPATDQAHTLQLTLDHQFKAGQYRAHTVPVRRYNIPQQDQTGKVSLLNQTGPPLWPGVVLKFPLGRDLPAGRYRLALVADDNAAGFVQASYTSEPMSPSLQIYSEVNHAL